MMNATATLNNLKSSASRGVTLPKKFTTELAALEDKYAAPRTSPRVDLAALVADAVSRDVDPYEDAAVRTALARIHGSTVIAAALNEARERALLALLEAWTAPLLASWRGPWRSAGAAVAAAAEALPGADLSRPGGVVAAGTTPALLTTWAKGHEAAAALDGIASAVALLVPRSRPEYTALVGAELTADQLDELQAAGRASSAWGAALHGVALDLIADPAALGARIAAVAADRQRHEDARLSGHSSLRWR